MNENVYGASTVLQSITTKGLLLFLLGCIPMRFVLALIALYIGNKVIVNSFTVLQSMGVVFALISMAMIILYFTKLRQRGPEVFGGSIWWNDHRIVHGMLYMLFAIMALQKKPYAWKVLVIDAIYGLIVFLSHHFYR